MSISSIGGHFPPQGLQNGLVSGLRSAGLSDTLAQTGQSEFKSALSSLSDGSGGFSPDKLKDALKKQLNGDVRSGKLTQEQSDQIASAFEKLGQEGPGGGGSQTDPLTSRNGGGVNQGAASTTLAGILDSINSGSGGKHAHGKHDGGSHSSTQGSGTTEVSTYLSELLSSGLLTMTA